MVAETLARPVLAERLLREAHKRQEAGKGGDRSFDSWWRASGTAGRPEVVEPAYDYRLPALAPGGNRWTPTFGLPEADLETTAVWTGAEMIVWGGTNWGQGIYNTGSRYNPATDTWHPTSGVAAAEPRKQHAAVWTGLEMIVYGGCGQLDEHNCQIGTGGRYNPQRDTWKPVSTVGSPGNRINPSAVWTGEVMIVWGGCAFTNNVCEPSAVGNDGGRYDPATDTWQPTSIVDAPKSRHFHTALWTGAEMIVWGGHDGDFPLNTGGRYNPSSDTWAATAVEPAARYDHTAVWTGSEMIVWGGCGGNFCNPALGDGARYHVATDTWRPVKLAGAPSPRGQHTAVWTGSVMVVWGGCSTTFCGNFLDTGGRYDPVTNSWTPTSPVNVPEARSGHVTVWTGSLMVVWGGDRAFPFNTPRTGGRYDPATDTWTSTNAAEAATPRAAYTAIWTGVEMVVWGGNDNVVGIVDTGSRYRPATDSWHPTSTANAPTPRHYHSAVWTGTEMIVWGGQYGSDITLEGGRYNPATNTWTDTATAGAPAARASHSAVWTGTEMIVWGGSGNPLWMNTGGRYVPATNSWTATPTAGAPQGRDGHSAVWTGQEMIVWGGYSNGAINSGARYVPSTNSWTPVSLAGAPAARSSHAAIWTGSRMLIWGGSRYLFEGSFEFFKDGRLYDPASDSWTPTSLVGAPTPRAAFAYVWTGARMIVWGGCPEGNSPNCSVGDGVFTGGRYDPVADTWHPTEVRGARARTYAVKGVWTGQEMIVWGGLNTDTGTYTSHGGRYTPPGEAEREP